MMAHKTMRISAVRTSVKLEPEFWDYLAEVARARGLRLTALVNEVADVTPGLGAACVRARAGRPQSPTRRAVTLGSVSTETVPGSVSKSTIVPPSGAMNRS